MCSFAHSLARFFRARQLSKMETFISNLSSFSYIHRYINILREMADILCALFDLLCNTSTRWYQLLSAGKTNKSFSVFLIQILFVLNHYSSYNRRCLWWSFDNQSTSFTISQCWSILSQWFIEQYRFGFVSIGLVALSICSSSYWNGIYCIGKWIRKQFKWTGTGFTSCQCW